MEWEGRGDQALMKMKKIGWRPALVCSLAAGFGVFASPGQGAIAGEIDLREAVIVTRPGDLPNAERTAAAVLSDEIGKRTGLHLPCSTVWPAGKVTIAVTSRGSVPEWGHAAPRRTGVGLSETKPEGYRLWAENEHTVWVLGADPRGALFGVGQLLRRLDWGPGKAGLPASLDIATAPAYPIRGHQLGYRPQANSYDAWDTAQFEQYIRELTFFGVNSIEGIPFQDDRQGPLMKVPRREMNRALSDICSRYGLDYWAWVPADFDLADGALQASFLKRCEQFFKDCKVFTGFFFPGGDPGKNPPELVLPFLEEIWKRLQPVHPQARIWLSLQWFNKEQIDFIRQYLEQKRPDWLAGLVVGPSSPPAASTRKGLPPAYKLRLYPDITHNKLSQFEVPAWDQAYALTLGREAINPRPAEFARVHHRFAPLSDGFISYSDGVHDDVNKTIWSALSWDPDAEVRDILVDYARVYFAPGTAAAAADGILALENNWRGPLANHGAVEGTLLMWRRLADLEPQLEGNWRWQMCLLRADYDAYVRRRLINESRLEGEANSVLAQAGERGAETVMREAAAILDRATDQPVAPELRRRIELRCAQLFASIGLQTSVEKYHASGEERGAVLDFVDLPLNNRWWLQDEFAKVRALGSEEEKCRRLAALATWENPGPGNFYDNVGNLSKSPHVVGRIDDSAREEETDPSQLTYWWWNEGKSRARLTWQITMWPPSMEYDGLDPRAVYVVRATGYGPVWLTINGERVKPTLDGRKTGELREFPVPQHCLTEGRLVLTWGCPPESKQLPWREQPRLAEVWLLRNPPGAAKGGSP
jgi:hypothetical protein